MTGKDLSPAELAKLLADGLAEVTSILRDLDRRLKAVEFLVLPRAYDDIGPRLCAYRAWNGQRYEHDCWNRATRVYGIAGALDGRIVYACCDEHRPEEGAILLRELPGKEERPK